MPRGGSLTLSDVRALALPIACERCGRHNVKRLIAVHGGDAKLTELLGYGANCEKARQLSIPDHCQGRFDASFRRRLAFG